MVVVPQIIAEIEDMGLPCDRVNIRLAVLRYLKLTHGFVSDNPCTMRHNNYKPTRHHTHTHTHIPTLPHFHACEHAHYATMSSINPNACTYLDSAGMGVETGWTNKPIWRRVYSGNALMPDGPTSEWVSEWVVGFSSYRRCSVLKSRTR